MLAAMEPRPRRCTRQGARLLLGAGGSDLARRVCNLLVDAPPDLISHIPFPVHIDDWQVGDARRAVLAKVTDEVTCAWWPLRDSFAQTERRHSTGRIRNPCPTCGELH